MRQAALPPDSSSTTPPATPQRGAEPSCSGTNITYQYFTLLTRKMADQPQQAHQMPDNMVRAVCEYLAWKANRPVALSAVALFLRQEWWQVLAKLREYPSVMPLMARTQHSADANALFYGDKPIQVFHAAGERVTACLAFEQGQLADTPLEMPASFRWHQPVTRARLVRGLRAGYATALSQREQDVTRREQALELNEGLHRLAVALAFLLGGLAGAGVLLYLGGKLPLGT